MSILQSLSSPVSISCDLLEDYSPEPAPFEPSPEEEAARLGFDLTIAGEDPAPPRGWEFRRLVAFYDGVYSGWRALAREEMRRIERDLDYEDWLDSLPDPEPDWESMYPEYSDHHFLEGVEAVGVIEVRKMEGAIR